MAEWLRWLRSRLRRSVLRMALLLLLARMERRLLWCWRGNPLSLLLLLLLLVRVPLLRLLLLMLRTLLLLLLRRRLWLLSSRLLMRVARE